MIPIRTDYKMTRRPWANYALVLANIVIFAMGYNGVQRGEMGLLQPDQPQLFQFFTCMFMHGGFWHLGGNMIFLWVFGNAINDRLGHLGYLLFYLAGGVLAGVGYLLLGGSAPVLGASGAIAAVTGAFLILLPRTRVTLLVFLFYLILPLEISSLFFIGLQFIWNVWSSIHDYVLPTGGGGVAYVAHSSGYVFGMAVALMLLAFKLVPSHAYDLFNLWRAYKRRAGYRRMVAEGYDPFRYTGRSSAPPTGRWTPSQADPPPPPTSAQEVELRRAITRALAAGDFRAAADRYVELCALQPAAVLPRQNQLDVANKLFQDAQYAPAADTYERYLKHYAEDAPDVQVLLAMLYAWYLGSPDRAKPLLEQALPRLRDQRTIQRAREILASVNEGAG
ncbi:MAG: rhomboid family intramembrane serine protease [Phycisphaerae bacterium]|nr:rhomboid family intramembrane serine protease [Phycisphaerae bacterium]